MDLGQCVPPRRAPSGTTMVMAHASDDYMKMKYHCRSEGEYSLIPHVDCTNGKWNRIGGQICK